MKITINNWNKYNPRKDLKHPSWLRLQNNFFESVNFYDFSPHEKLAFIYLLCYASKNIDEPGVVDVNFSHALKVGNLKKSDLENAIKKLELLQIVTTPVQDPNRSVRDPNRSVRDLCTTRRDETRRDETERDGTQVVMAVSNDAKSKEKGAVEEFQQFSDILFGVTFKLQKFWLENYEKDSLASELVKIKNWTIANSTTWKSYTHHDRFFAKWLNKSNLSKKITQEKLWRK